MIRAILHVICKQLRDQDFRGITWPFALFARAEEPSEFDFSFCAVCRASASLAAASALGPADVVDATLPEEAEAGALIASRHGFTLLASIMRS
jgi:hypothetical protein